MPESDRNINVMPIVLEVQKYSSTTVFYQNYVSLTDQRVKSIQLSSAVAERGRNVSAGAEIISEENYIFEPSTHAVIDHLERSMIQITISEVILESKLAQYASRFKAMSAAHTKTNDTVDDLKYLYNHVKRQTKDERLKELVKVLMMRQQT
jgi:F0F1-type ATP synthase gamma subunit